MTRRRVVAALLASAALVFGASLASGATNDISTVAGSTGGFSGDGGPATAAQLRTPVAVAATSDGGYLIADQGNSRIRRVSPTGVITTVAGNGTAGFSGDNGAATSAQLNAPNGVAEMPGGGFLIADSNNNRVRRVLPNGTIITVAGGGTQGLGDGGPATAAQIAFPVGVAVRADGSFLVADNDNHRIRQVDANGTITTVAGTSAGFSGDNGPATSAQLNGPTGVHLMPDGGYLISDSTNNRVRRVSQGGTITTVAGGGSQGLGDGGPATSAQLNNPQGVTAVAGGGFAIADTGNQRVRQVSGGTIATVAGTGTAGFSGDGGPASAAQLNGPFWVALSTAGHLLIADTFNNRVRQIEGPPPPQPQPPLPLPTPPDDPLTLDELTAADPPTLGQDVNVGPVGDGPVLIAVPAAAATAGRARASQKGLTFVPLTEARQIPVGSFLDTKGGTVELRSATLRAGRVQTGRFSSGLFQVLQSRARRARGLTEVRLKGSSFSRCRRSGRGRAGAAQVSRRTIRRLRSNANGRFRSRGKHSSATVRGTVWITADRCDGTLTTVRRGRVAVRDFRRKRTVIVRAGKRYLARAPR